jgi:hypothetical protein
MGVKLKPSIDNALGDAFERLEISESHATPFVTADQGGEQ